MGVSRIRVNIERLVLRGFAQPEAKAIAKAFELQLSQVLAEGTPRNDWARPHRTPVLKLGRMPMEAGSAGAVRFGTRMARAVVRGLKT